MKIKICGITNIEDAKLTTDLGAWALGFIFYKKSPRYIEPEKVKEILSQLGEVKTVGVFVDEELDSINEIMKTSGCTIVQLHGKERPSFCGKLNFEIIKKVNKENISKFKEHLCLVDAPITNDQHGGTGELSNWKEAKEMAKKSKLILAGGLNSENIAKAKSEVDAFAYDLSSGVEISPGVKDHNKLKELFKIVGTL